MNHTNTQRDTSGSWKCSRVKPTPVAAVCGATHTLQNNKTGYSQSMTFFRALYPSSLFSCAGLIVFSLAVWPQSRGYAQNFRVIRHVSASEQSSDGKLLLQGNVLYGLTAGTYNYGGVFRMNTNGTGYTVIKSFSAPVYDGVSSYTNADGATPLAGLVSDGTILFGTAAAGGTGGKGTLFSMNTNGSGFTVLKHFTGPDGKNPYAELLLVGNTIHGTTIAGGTSNRGTIFRINKDGTDFAVLKSLTTSDGMIPLRGLVISGETLYGAAYQGGAANYGTIFSVKTNGADFTVLHHFTSGQGTYPHSTMVLSDNTLCGTTDGYDNEDESVVFKINTGGSDYAVIKHFAPVDPVYGTNDEGSYVREGLVLAGHTLYGTTRWGGNSGNGVVFAMGFDGSGYTVLKHFSAQDASGRNSDGAIPLAPLMLANGTLFGTTDYGGIYGYGTTFCLEVAPSILTSDSSFGLSSNRFGFHVAGYSNQTVVIEACDNLSVPHWDSVQTNTIGGSPVYFSTPAGTNDLHQFFRVRAY
jgi:uncharacterized repeat protein (TIGR03803 family)